MGSVFSCEHDDDDDGQHSVTSMMMMMMKAGKEEVFGVECVQTLDVYLDASVFYQYMHFYT